MAKRGRFFLDSKGRSKHSTISRGPLRGLYRILPIDCAIQSYAAPFDTFFLLNLLFPLTAFSRFKRLISHALLLQTLLLPERFR